MSSVTSNNNEKNKKPNEQGAHINLKVKEQVHSCVPYLLFLSIYMGFDFLLDHVIACRRFSIFDLVSMRSFDRVYCIMIVSKYAL